jgi:hypothetical protein
MKPMKSILIAFVLLVGATTNVALASHSHAHFSSHPSVQHNAGWHGHGPHWGGGFYGPVWPWFYPGYYGYAIPVFPDSFYSDSAAPVEFIQMSPTPTAVDAPANSWYYCDESQGYYPYVKSCAGGWKQVPATPSK